jgi:hypothetical protein
LRNGTRSRAGEADLVQIFQHSLPADSVGAGWSGVRFGKHPRQHGHGQGSRFAVESHPALADLAHPDPLSLECGNRRSRSWRRRPGFRAGEKSDAAGGVALAHRVWRPRDRGGVPAQSPVGRTGGENRFRPGLVNITPRRPDAWSPTAGPEPAIIASSRADRRSTSRPTHRYRHGPIAG